MSDLSTTPGQVVELNRLSPILDSWGQVRVGFWRLWYWIKRQYLGGWIAGLLFLFSLLELVSPLLHEWLGSTLQWLLHRVFPHNDYHFWKTTGFHNFLLFVLVISSLMIFLDHRKLKNADRLNKQLLAYLKWLVENSWICGSGDGPLESCLVEVLDGLIDALGPSDRRGKDNSRSPLCASLLCSTGSSDGTLFILAQDSRNVFDASSIFLGRDSVAGAIVSRGAADGDSGFLIYVPWTKFTHGLSFEYRADRKHDSVEVIDYLPRIYKQIDEPGQKHLGSLLCIGVELQNGTRVEDPRFGTIYNPKLVLSISSSRCDRLGDRVFDAARIVSRFLPQVFR